MVAQELKIEKKGDADLAKLQGEIDALKEEATQVRGVFPPDQRSESSVGRRENRARSQI